MTTSSNLHELINPNVCLIDITTTSTSSNTNCWLRDSIQDTNQVISAETRNNLDANNIWISNESKVSDGSHHIDQLNGSSYSNYIHNNNNNDNVNDNIVLPISQLALSYAIKPLGELESRIDFYFSESWLSGQDERTSKLPFMSGGPWKLLIATIIYLYLIKSLLPVFMSNRRPFELQWPIRCYNLLMVVSNLYAFYHGIRILRFGLKCFGCEVVNHKDYSSEAIELLHYGWLFMLSRLIEWIDTIFFVLRKKYNQVSKLHVFHHSFVPIFCWFYLKYHPGATMAFFPLVNTFVHTIMYSYYFLATFGPKIQPFLWWKKYLTSLQITQFILILIQLASIPLSANESCQYPRGFIYMAFAGAILFLWLFYTYYLDTYRRPSPSPSSSSKQTIQSETVALKRGQQQQEKLQVTNNIKQREGSSRAISDLVDDSIIMR